MSIFEGTDPRHIPTSRKPPLGCAQKQRDAHMRQQVEYLAEAERLQQEQRAKVRANLYARALAAELGVPWKPS